MFFRDKKTGNEQFAVIDCETSGLDQRNDRILSFAFLPVRQNRILLQEAKELYIEQPLADFKQSAFIHGLLPGLHQEINEAEGIRLIRDLCVDFVIVGHHISFDLGMINAASIRHGHRKLKNRKIDTATLYHRLTAGSAPYQPITLDNLSEKLGIRPVGRHTAGGDTLTTALVFIKLLRMAEKKGIRSVRSLSKKPGNPLLGF